MKTKLFTLIFVILSIMISYGQKLQEHSNIRKDIYERIILDENGNKINYPYDKNIDYNLDSPTNTGIEKELIDKIEDQSSCTPSWKYTIMGTEIGKRSMKAIDIDLDGNLEIICSAKFNYYSYWYILRYNPISHAYDHVWTSEMYDGIYNYITRMKVFDINNDNIYEIFIGFSTGKTLVYRSDTKEKIAEIPSQNSYAVNDIEFGDADNDENNEIAISSNNKIYLYSAFNFNYKNVLSYTANEFAIGNVDADSSNEIVTSSGKVLSMISNNVLVKWNFDSYTSYDSGYMIEISDLDNDGQNEIIRAKSWDTITVYNAYTHTRKFNIKTPLDISAFIIQDVNNDFAKEIIYGDNQWGKVHCFNTTTQQEMWAITNPEHGVAAISIGDFDQNDSLEVIWTSNGDNFYVVDMITKVLKWTAPLIDGPFYAIDIGDVDNDGNKEIVAVSYESDMGYGSGIISIFDATTKILKWQSTGNFILYSWMGIYNVKICDFDSDGLNEIVIANGNTYTGKICVINGQTKVIESSYEYNTENIDEFYTLDINDVDNDGQKEFITGTKGNGYGGMVCVINPSNYSIEWKVDSLISTNQYPYVITGNVDSDTENEIIYCSGNIWVLDAVTHQKWQPLGSNYSTFALSDINGDGVNEILAGTIDGYLKTISGQSHQQIASVKISNTKIDGIRPADLVGDSNAEYVITSGGRIYFYADSSQYIYSQTYAPLVGAYNGIKVADLNNDGKNEIILGTTYTLLEISSSCYECMRFNTDVTKNNVTCGGINDGSIVLNPTGGTSPYVFQWNNGIMDSSNLNLGIGNYIYTVTDQLGCTNIDTISISQAKLIATMNISDVTCNDTSNGLAFINITEGLPPFSYHWSNSDTTSSQTHLSPGNYSVTISEYNNCSTVKSFIINKDSLEVYFSKYDISCHGQNNGSIHINIYSGNEQYTYLWNDGSSYISGSSVYMSSIGPGIYSVTITDQSGCSASKSFEFTDPAGMTIYLQTSWDNPLTQVGEGTASITVTGGIPPYHIQWGDPYVQTLPTATNLTAGIYTVSVTDSHYCIEIDTLVIDTVNGIDDLSINTKLSIYPNPSNGILHVNLNSDNKQYYEFKIFNSLGEIVFNNPNQLVMEKELLIDLKDIDSGIYLLSIYNKNIHKNVKFQILR